jgi:3-oxoacyl-[acyl-carrier protein] reductase
VRVVWLRTTGLPESLADVEFPGYGTGKAMTREELIPWLEQRTMLKRLTSLEDVGNAAAFMASDRAGSITASAANLTSGSVPD